jgi:ABC-type dipeptide/oligopeptide/nickel transport system ATPase component
MIIGMIGDIGSGKSYTAELICRLHGFEKKRYGTPIKQITSLLLGENPDSNNIMLHDTQEYKSKVVETPWRTMETVRSVHKKVSDVLADSFHKDVLINLLLSNYDPCVDNWVVDDTRSYNQCQKIIDMGGHIIVVTRQLESSNFPFKPINDSDHNTEKEWKQWYIDNSSLLLNRQIHILSNTYATMYHHPTQYELRVTTLVDKLIKLYQNLNH